MPQPWAFSYEGDFGDRVERIDPDLWESALVQGSALWGDTDFTALRYYELAEQYWLHIWRREHSLALLYAVVGSDRSRITARVSVANPARLDEFSLMTSGDSVPAGSFSEWGPAAKAIVEFLRDPTQPAKSVDWIDSDSVKWPDGKSPAQDLGSQYQPQGWGEIVPGRGFRVVTLLESRGGVPTVVELENGETLLAVNSAYGRDVGEEWEHTILNTGVEGVPPTFVLASAIIRVSDPESGRVLYQRVGS